MIKSNAVRSAARSMKHIATRKWLFAVIIATATLLISPVLDDLKRVSVRIALHKKITVDPVATENDSDSSTNHDLTLLPLGLTRQILAERETIDKLLTRGMSDLPESIVDTRSYGAIFFCGSAATEAELWDCTYNVAASAIALRDTGFKHPVAMAPLLMDGAESTALWEDYLFHYNIAIIQAAPDELGGKSQPQANRSSSVLIAALEAAPFENVIALDAKTIALKDPSFLFDNAEFLNHGCIFWPGINAEYSSETNRIMEEILFNAVPKGQLSEKMPLRPEGETSSRDAPVFSTDVLVLNKRKTWRAIQLAKHFSVGAPFYNQILPDVGALLFWAFRGTKSAFSRFDNPPVLIGTIVDKNSAKGITNFTNDVQLLHPDRSNPSPQESARLCGQAVGYLAVSGSFYSGDFNNSGTEHSLVLNVEDLMFVNSRWVMNYDKDAHYMLAAVHSPFPITLANVSKIGDFQECRMLESSASKTHENTTLLDLKKAFPQLDTQFHQRRERSRHPYLMQKLKARRFRTSILPFESSIAPNAPGGDQNPSVAFARRVKRGTRGVVITGSGAHAHNAIMTTILLRETGCTLPVEFLYMKGQLSQLELEWIESFNITTVDFAPSVKSYSADWRPEEWRLGAAKVFAILASSFEEVLFLDPDNFVIRDPTYLFETRTYRKYGSIFWPDFPIRKSGIGVWDILEMEGRFWRELEFETGQIVINKRASWRGLIMAMHISAEARFYFRHFLGDKEAFFWGYAASQTPYYLAPNYIHSVGLIVSDEYPRGNSTVGIDKKNRFCGLSMLQSDFPDNGPSTNRTNFPQPLFMHWNMVKKNQYKSDVNYFQSAMTYDLQAGVHAADIENVNYNFVGEVGQFKHCVSIWPVKGGPVRSWDWNTQHPGMNERFHKAHNFSPTIEQFNRTRWPNFVRDLPEYERGESLSNAPARGIVMTVSNDVIQNVARTVMLIRNSGCKLPVEVVYRPGDILPEQADFFRKMDITPINVTIENSSIWPQLAPSLSILASSFEDILFLDPTVDTMPVQDPSYLFDTETYAKAGGLFWQAFEARDVNNSLWDSLELRGGKADRPEMQFEPALMLVSKRRAWKALKLAEHLLRNNRFSENAKNEPLFWTFAATNTPYHLNPHFFTILGPSEGSRNSAVANGSSSVPPSPSSPDTAFCGSARLFFDSDDITTRGASDTDSAETGYGDDRPLRGDGTTERSDRSGGGVPHEQRRPAFVRMDFEVFPDLRVGEDYFQRAMVYRATDDDPGAAAHWSGRRSLAEFEPLSTYRGENGVSGHRRCIGFKEANGLAVDISEWKRSGFSDEFWKIYSRVQ